MQNLHACSLHRLPAWEEKNIDRYLQDKANPFHEEYGWYQLSVKIRLLKEGMKWASENKAPELEIPGVYHQSIIDIIKSVFMDDVAASFNMTPYCEYWQCSEDCSIKCMVASVMFWSDTTHLANFGDASLWPFYLFFGNQSKYTQGKLMTSACHHVAYIPSLPEDLQDQYMDIFGGPTTSQVYMHCKHELMQVIWALLLDNKFMHAYVYGIVIKCSDGVTSNYPKKVILTGIKNLGQCLCPRCLTWKDEVHLMGMKHDMKWCIRCRCKDDWRLHREVEDTRVLIFQSGASVDGTHVKNVLNNKSSVPTQNAFSEKLSAYDDFNWFWMFVVDQLHEFELGVWKAIFIHLMCILHAAGGNAVQKLNERYVI
ncbi:hypothetical protein BDR05DRAFT_976158 [Suillus weaverae]|nr:hypothetical protein BDR05DRAFT_976158 [Suillus weaverae]